MQIFTQMRIEATRIQSSVLTQKNSVLKNTESQSNHDKELISKANNLNPIDWGDAFDMAEQADSVHAYMELKRIGRRLYHKEEGSSI